MKKNILILAFIPIITLADTQIWQSFDNTQSLAKLTRLQNYVNQKCG
ncbi:peptide-methionine (R)-S-oxide reductase, partial [Francisella tularensis subsp. holarctica]|nr:peptide-methionine (R)-S-oxide reductase [Francisella tularensis subsp. holarctica]